MNRVPRLLFFVGLTVVVAGSGCVGGYPTQTETESESEPRLQPMMATIEAETLSCPDSPPWGQQLSLDYPASIEPKGGVLDTPLVVRTRDFCVPVWTDQLCENTFTVCSTDADCGGASCVNAKTCANDQITVCEDNHDCPGDPGQCVNTWGWQKTALRTYGFPKDPGKRIVPADPADPNIQWGFPGPTLRARTQILQNPARAPHPVTNPQLHAGTRVKIQLYNYLAPQGYHEAMQCNTAKTCDDDNGNACSNDSDCNEGARCVELKQVPPECFHGDNVTNLHYHGTHVSPQPHQDFVLLSLFPYGSTGVPGGSPNYAVGRYDTDINPLPWNQAPGTHWYHPHKHGSTSIQVLNGMAGAFIITGPFDDWLNELYDGELVERVLSVQQISAELKFLNRDLPNYPPQALVNGLATPVIQMRPGEIQRFRFIGATMQASAALEIGFDERIREVRQIAQDGVQFVSENYRRQPFRDSEGTYSNFKLFPGNRADFLVKAPEQEGSYAVGSHVVAQNLDPMVQKVFARAADVTDLIPSMPVPAVGFMAVDEPKPPINPNSGSPLLFTIEVSGEPKPMDFPLGRNEAACQSTPERCWPATPAYLQDLTPPGTDPRQLDFSMAGNPADPPSFYINKTQYQGGCAGATMTLGTTEDWRVSNVKGPGNDTLLPHPFHIHINPFQVVRNADRTFDPPYVWQDTIALPVKADEASDQLAGPIWNNQDAQTECRRACAAENATWNGQWKTTVQGQMSVCGCQVTSDSVLIRHKFEDYTGGYVIHCHFLGHEDRGMMWNVQTVCPPQNALRYGSTRTDGAADSCTTTSPALPRCTLNPAY